MSAKDKKSTANTSRTDRRKHTHPTGFGKAVFGGGFLLVFSGSGRKQTRTERL
jgi:hypothetical protein